MSTTVHIKTAMRWSFFRPWVLRRHLELAFFGVEFLVLYVGLDGCPPYLLRCSYICTVLSFLINIQVKFYQKKISRLHRRHITKHLKKLRDEIAYLSSPWRRPCQLERAIIILFSYAGQDSNITSLALI